jgi:demethylmenaquinone methyltransferase/2-methoxy-6-polyprenyl-1,4-benzoquinol methylase
MTKAEGWEDQRQKKIERLYRCWARIYEFVTPLYLLGNESVLRRRAVQALALGPGGSVLDLACGTGRNFEPIQRDIGPYGYLVGLDYSTAMLEVARRRVEVEGWTNVALVRADAACSPLGLPFDAALCTLAMSVIPRWERALQGMVDQMIPGGRIVVADARHSGRVYARGLNPIADLLGWGAAADMGRRPWRALEKLVDDCQYEEWFMGFFYLAAGIAPRGMR